MGWLKFPKYSNYFSITACLLIMIFGYIPFVEVQNILSGHVVALLVVGAAFSRLMVKHQVHEIIATNALAYISPKNLSSLSVTLMLISAFLSMWISNTSAVVMLIPVVLAISSKIECSAENMLLAIAYGATMGGMLTPIGTPANLVAIDYAARFFDLKIGFAQWFLGVAPFVLTFMAFFAAYLWFSKSETINFKQAKANITQHQMTIIRALSTCVLLWATKTLPFGGWEGMLVWVTNGGLPSGLSRIYSEEAIGLATLVFCMFQFCPDKKQLWALEDITKISYSSIIMVIASLFFAEAVSQSGAVELIADHLKTLAHMSNTTWLLLVSSMVSMVTELCSNTAVTALSITLIDLIQSMTGMSVISCIFIITLSANSAFMLPTATPPNAMIIATEKISIAKTSQVGFCLSLLSILLLYFIYL
ncbi:anion permease [Candidatus Comchoanobacter bicostacola]|uniref:Anion permease n=1 Tax=Candidatus Comchoanobacter bicostacola TaxID=2919598 RepID=A0ABY5DK72_9GAMM|nr:anion permease [Candidatus Comchoanobacter bicostacola]